MPAVYTGLDLPLQAAMFLGCVFESMGYGLLTVMVFFTLRSLMANTQTRYPSKLLLAVLCAIWTLSTGHWISNVYRAYQAFNVFPEGPTAFYETLNLPSYTGRNVVYCLLVITSDCFAVYRVFRVWNGNWFVIILPMIMVCGSAVAGFTTTYFFAHLPPGPVFDTPIVPWGTAWYSMNLSTNGMCTLLVAYRIIQSQMAVRKLSRVAGTRLWNTLVIILESAAIYSVSLVLVMTGTIIGANWAFVCLDLTVATVGITFTLIILRVSLGVSSDTQTSDSTRYPSTRSGDVTVNVSRLVEVSGTNTFTGSNTITGPQSAKNTFSDEIKLDRVDRVV